MNWIFKVLPWKKVGNQDKENKEIQGTQDNHNLKQRAVIADKPIQNFKEDVLNRSRIARSFAQQIRELDATEGLVVGVLGAWGSGKTSLINLARDEFEQANIPVLDFNPWMFSGTEQLVESFFTELSAQLKMRSNLAEVGKNLESYGEIFANMKWLPLVGSWIEEGHKATKTLGKLLQQRKEGIAGRRKKLEKALTDLDKPILVVLDDIDRLSTPEIRNIFKLVRLTASFPNIIYLLAFDRIRVEQALSEDGVPGRDYLEKILQVALDLPAIPNYVLTKQIAYSIDKALDDIQNPGAFHKDVWSDVFMEIIKPLIRNMRDVRRYSSTIRGTVVSLEGQVALADVLSLEAIRVFLPDVFRQLHPTVEGLTEPSKLSAGSSCELPHLKKQIDDLIDIAGDKSEVVKAMIDRLFPASKRHIGGSHYGPEWRDQWLRERRVAHTYILRFYLERVVGEGLQAFTEAEQAWRVMNDYNALNQHLRSLDMERLEDVISSLEAYEEEFAPDHVVPTTIVLLNLLPELPERPRSMFDIGPYFKVSRVIYRLLKSLDHPDEVEAKVYEILPKLRTLSSKLVIITMIGYRKGAGHQLVSRSAAQTLEQKWRKEVCLNIEDLDLSEEYDLLRVLVLTKTEQESSEPQFKVPDQPEFTLALLNNARSYEITQSIESRASQRSLHLAWDSLIKLFGDEEVLQKRIQNLEELKLEVEQDLIELAHKYLNGWRPD